MPQEYKELEEVKVRATRPAPKGQGIVAFWNNAGNILAGLGAGFGSAFGGGAPVFNQGAGGYIPPDPEPEKDNTYIYVGVAVLLAVLIYFMFFKNKK